MTDTIDRIAQDLVSEHRSGAKFHRLHAIRNLTDAYHVQDAYIAATIGDEVVRIQHKYPAGNAVELRFFDVRDFAGELENRIFREIVWADPKTLPSYDFLEADLTLVKDLASGKIR